MSFLAPLFLAATLAGLIPVVLHLIHRHKAPEVKFATLWFLRRSVERTRRRKYLDDVSLLLVRALVLVLLAIGLAGPVVTVVKGFWGRGRTSAIAIVFDNSASMAIMDGGQTRVETARHAAEQVLDTLHDGDAVAFLPTGGPPAPENGKLSHSHETVRQALAACRISHERADLVSRLAQARALLREADTPNKEIYILTDNQAISWEGLEQESEGPAPTAVPVILVNIGGDPAPNVALREARLEAPALAVGVPLAVSVELVNGSNLPQQRNLELHIDGRRETTSPTLTVPAGGRLRHTFRFSVDQPGAHRGELHLPEEDGSALDNRLFFTTVVGQPVPVAVVKPRQPEVAYADDAFYLERVLAPADGWSIRTTMLTPADLLGESLSNYAVVFCVNLPTPELATAQRLCDYVDAGGHLVWICGSNTDADVCNRLNQQLSGHLLPGNLAALREPVAGKQDSWPIGFLDKDYPALAPLQEPASLYQSVLVYRHFPIEAAEGSGARVLARLTDSQPLLVEKRQGAGSVLLWGTGMHMEWTNLPVKPLFLPLMTRLTFHLAGLEAERSQMRAGSPLTIPLQEGQVQGEVEVVRPSGEILRLRPEGRTFRYADTYEPGVYEVRLSGSHQPRVIAFAVNADPAECDATLLEREDLVRHFGRSPLVYCEKPEELPAAIRRLREGQSLWEVFLAAVLAGLVLESYLANQRGRKPTVASPISIPERRLHHTWSSR
jgi:hypothetical protein